MNETLNSDFQIAPFDKAKQDEVTQIFNDILDERGAFDCSELHVDDTGRLIRSSHLADENITLNDEGTAFLYDRLDRLLSLIRKQFEAWVHGSKPQTVTFLSRYEEVNQDDAINDSVLKWHADGKRFAFISFGGIAQIQCIRGQVEIAFEDKRERPIKIIKATQAALESRQVQMVEVSDITPVLLGPNTVHRKGPNQKDGHRITMLIHYG